MASPPSQQGGKICLLDDHCACDLHAFSQSFRTTQIRRHAQMVFEHLIKCYVKNKVWMEAFLEQGCIPILFVCIQQQGTSFSPSKSAEPIASQLINVLQDQLHQSKLLVHLTKKVMNITISQKHRTNIAIALVLLSCGK